MKAPASRRSGNERGQGLIEFALLTPFIILFIAAIVMLGLALNARSSLQQGVREGARRAAVGGTLTEVQDLAAGNAREYIDPADVQWCHPPGPGGTRGQVGDPVRVYIFDSGDEGYPVTLVPSGGTPLATRSRYGCRRGRRRASSKRWRRR
jgi:hypothetical protein